MIHRLVARRYAPRAFRRWTTYFFALAFLPTVALAQQTSAMPEHSWVISMDQALSRLNVDLEHVSTSPHGGSGAVIVIQPSVDFALKENLTLGGLVGITRDDGRGQTEFAIQMRVGYNIPIIDKLSFWPRGGLELGFGSLDMGGSTIRLTIAAIGTFDFYPVPHFFIGLGPFFRDDLVRTVGGNDAGRVTEVGVTYVIGGVI